MMAFAEKKDQSEPDSGSVGRVPLTKREREILGALAEGLSGAQIAEQLVLSPETVRTHVRNAMAKLGASTRSQAVALALRQNQISAERESTPSAAPPAPPAPRRTARTTGAGADPATALRAMLDGLVSLYDVNGGAVYVAEEDGLSLRRIAMVDGLGALELAEEIALGDGALGRAALERRAQLLQPPSGESGAGGALIAAPMIGGGRLLGVIALGARISRPIGRSELLLLQAFANRCGEVLLAGGGDVDRRLERAMQRFQASWSGTPRVA
jgi:DNA-binding CsgD family transcriptional regulator